MEENMRKRNTDCVYFLASPFTCKKGIDCEFRHSETARLNPTDCWYWLTGNCLNPSCAFRHPPLDTPTEAPPASASLPTAPLNKSNVPCYFYFNGFCNKGEKCSFAHCPEDTTPAGKSSKTTIAIAEALHVENKTTSNGNGTRSVPTETHIYTAEWKPKVALDIKYQPKEVSPQAAHRNLLKQSMSPRIFFSACDAVMVRPGSLPGEGVTQSSYHQCTDQSSEELVGDHHVELEARWESSPGLDVLVDDESENFVSEDDLEYSLNLDRELNNHFLGYDFEDAAEFDPSYSDAELLYECQSYEFNDCLDDGRIFDSIIRTPCHSSERVSHSIVSRKRKLLPMEMAVHDQNGIDLRDHLRKGRVIDDRPIAHLSTRHGRCHPISRYHERPRRPSTNRRPHRRLASEVRKNNAVGWHEDNRTLANGFNHRDPLRRSQSNNRSRNHYKDKRLAKPHTEASRKRDFRDRASQTSTTFTGPKTLTQIKEETRKVEGNTNFEKIRHSSKPSSADFKGPKPLNEILEEKRRVNSTPNVQY